uniref:tRNA-binding domain-containing protein n=1 Tax=Macrostomum lignano TaxID=282301 RepID=A0A1I8FBI3_9PLAT
LLFIFQATAGSTAATAGPGAPGRGARPAGDAFSRRRQVHWRRRQPAAAAAARSADRENAELRAEADRLRDEMIRLQMRNGVAQVPLLRPEPPSSASASATVAAPTPSAAAEKPKADSKAGSAATAATAAASNKKPGKAAGQPRIPASQPSRRRPPAKNPLRRRRRLDVTRLDLRVGRIVSAEKHPDAMRSTLKLSTLARRRPNHCRLAVFLLNLKPAKMRGILQRRHDHVRFRFRRKPCRLRPASRPAIACPWPAVRVRRAAPDAQLNPKKKIWEALKPHCLVDADGYAGFNGAAGW